MLNASLSKYAANRLSKVRAMDKSSRDEKFRLSVMSIAVMTVFAPALMAAPLDPSPTQLPTGGKLLGGQAAITQSTAVMTINQATAKAAISWTGFDLGKDATININQPSSSSVLLNQVLSSNPTQIFGKINANGQVFLTNPNGVYFSPSASVNVGGLVATTNVISSSDFMSGLTTFTSNGTAASVINDGNLTASLGGYIALLAPSVINNGVIVAQMGAVVLAAGNQYALQFAGTTLSTVTVSAAQIATLVTNGNAIYAPGGLLILSAQSAAQIRSGVVGNTGVLNANGATSSGGVIRLTASQTINAGGTMSADALPQSGGQGGAISIIADLTNPTSQTNITGSIYARGGKLGGNGGNIETSATTLKVGNDAMVNTTATKGSNGTWLIDPVDYTVATSGGDISGATLGVNLANTDIEIRSSGNSGSGTGNININDAITWTSGSLLTLNAWNNININSSVTAVLGKLSLLYGQGAVASGNTSNYVVNAPITLPSGNNFSTQQGTNGIPINYYVITALGNEGSISGIDLQGINGSPTISYALGANIDASGTLGWNSGAGFAPIASFSGNFDGLGHTITGLTINRPTSANVGLFGMTQGVTTIQNVGLVGGDTTGGSSTGGLVGNNDASLINNSYNNGSVRGGPGTGGLVGSTLTGNITNSHSEGVVRGLANTGGLLGSDISGIVSNSYATGKVEGNAGSGGLVGSAVSGMVNKSYATGKVSGYAGTGGLVGSITSGSINNSYANGQVDGYAGTGGLVGSITSGGISNSHAIGNVNTASNWAAWAGVGGLVGSGTSGSITNTYATGNVQGAAGTGGLVGAITSGAISNASASGSVQGAAGTGGLVGSITSGAISKASASGDVTGAAGTGGLVGSGTSGSITNTFALGNVMGAAGTGGLVGSITSGSILNSYAFGHVTGAAGTGGIVGATSGAVINSYWNTNNGPISSAGGGTGLTSDQMKIASNFNGWDFTRIWSLPIGSSSPTIKKYRH